MYAALAGFLIGILGGLIGLGGAEFRLPVLIAVFGFIALEAVIMNKAVSLILVASALAFRGLAIPFDTVLSTWPFPTMLVGFARYSRDQSFAVLGRNRPFLIAMVAGSIAGALVGAMALAFVAEEWLIPLLVVILLVSAVKVWRHA